MELEKSRHLATILISNKLKILTAWYQHQFADESLSKWSIAGLTDMEEQVAITTFLEPLFCLFIEYLTTHEKIYLHGYLDERLRYAPHRESPQVRGEFFQQVIIQDLDILYSCLSEQNMLSDSIQEYLIEIHEPLLTQNKAELSILALGDCLMNEIRVFLPHIINHLGIQLDMRCIYFSALTNRGIDLTEIEQYIDNNQVDFIALSLLSYEALPLFSMLLKEIDGLSQSDIIQRIEPIMIIFQDMIDGIRNKTEVPLMIHGVSGLPLGKYRKRIGLLSPFSRKKTFLLDLLNIKIAELVEATDNAFFIDEYKVAKKRGFRESAKEVFPKRIVNKGMVHTARLGYYLCQEYVKVVEAYKRLSKCKALMVDFDNTLWKGVIGDEEVNHFHDKQLLLKQLKDAGILLVSVSKNTESNIRWDEMTLKKNDFVMHKINWDLKVISISNAVNELNIGMDSIVFLDDNPVELDLVEHQLPSVVTLNATEEKTWQQLQMLFNFPVTKQTEESLKRTEMYREAFERKKTLNAESFNYAEMMSTLDLQVQFRLAEGKDLERLYELVSRTNQFNTTTVRYSKEQLEAFMASNEYQVYIATLGDKFGGLGIVLVLILKFEGDSVIIDSFVMSCRAMGFMLETQILHLLTTNQSNEIAKIIGLYNETDRNTPCKNLYSSNHFKLQEDNSWHYEIGKSDVIEKVEWISCE